MRINGLDIIPYRNQRKVKKLRVKKKLKDDLKGRILRRGKKNSPNFWWRSVLINMLILMLYAWLLMYGFLLMAAWLVAGINKSKA